MSKESNKIVANKLQEATPSNEIKYRQANFKAQEGKKVQMLAYVDARYVMQKLDDCFGAENWTNEYILIGNKTFCKLTATFPDGTTVSKMDVGAETDFEQEKGVVSDSLKRTAVLFGIGRDLYSLPKYWATTGYKGIVSNGWTPNSQNTSQKSGGGVTSQTTSDTSQPYISPSPPDSESSIKKYADKVVDNLAKISPVNTDTSYKVNTKLPPNVPPKEEKPVNGMSKPDVMACPNLEVKYVSAKAIGVIQHGNEDLDKDSLVFIPKGQIIKGDLTDKGDVGTITIPTWLIDDKGLKTLQKDTPDNKSNDLDDIPF